MANGARDRIGIISWSRSTRAGWVLVFVFGYALVDLLPVILPSTPVFRGLGLGDLADVVLIFVLVVLYVELGSQANLYRSLKLRVAYTGALLLMVQGHAIHLAANAIANASQPGAQGWGLADFLDETWGHVELHFAFLLLGALFIGCGRSDGGDGSEPVLSATEKTGLWIAAVIYGVLLGADAVEGQTAPLMLPCAIALFVWGWFPYLERPRGGDGRARMSLYRRFFATSFGVTALALLIYWLIMDGFPQFSTLAAAG
ncbi:MAG: hypothetical protein JSV86_04480 [Gemmatimonadota bacterium]|nr:MAG: hypothetical protein JSV86_04480 [Gemmatimonadota bacterium]